MFVNYIIKTPTCFGHSCLTILRGPFSVLSAFTTTLLFCVVRLFIWYVAVYYLQYNVCIRMIPWFLYQDIRSEAYDGKEYRLTYVCAWLMYMSVQTSTSGTHTHRHTATYQINNLTQTSRKAVTALSTENVPLKMVKQEWPKHVGVLMMCFTNIFNNLVF